MSNQRELLETGDRDATVAILQSTLYDLIDLALQGKQAHWNLVGPHFRSVHLELDEIVDVAREAYDDVAERMATLGEPTDGQASGITGRSRLDAFPEGFVSTEKTVTLYSDRISGVIEGLRDGIAALGDHDPVSEDLFIGIAAQLEKQLWMLQSQEG